MNTPEPKGASPKADATFSFDINFISPKLFESLPVPTNRWVISDSWKLFWCWPIWTYKMSFEAEGALNRTTNKDGWTTVDLVAKVVSLPVKITAPWWMRLLYWLIARPCQFVRKIGRKLTDSEPPSDNEPDTPQPLSPRVGGQRSERNVASRAR